MMYLTHHFHCAWLPRLPSSWDNSMYLKITASRSEFVFKFLKFVCVCVCVGLCLHACMSNILLICMYKSNEKISNNLFWQLGLLLCRPVNLPPAGVTWIIWSLTTTIIDLQIISHWRLSSLGDRLGCWNKCGKEWGNVLFLSGVSSSLVIYCLETLSFHCSRKGACCIFIRDVQSVYANVNVW